MIEEYAPHLFVALFSLFGFFFLFGLIWFLITTLLRKLAKMSKDFNVATGAHIKESGWGSMKVNGVTVRNCAKICEYQNGYMIRVMRIFGGGLLWLPKEQITKSDIESKGFFQQKSIEISCNGNNVVLYGVLAEFIV